MEKMGSDAFVVGLVLCAFFVLLLYRINQALLRRVNSVIWLRNRLAEVLIGNYNQNVPLLPWEQVLLNAFHENGIIVQSYDNPRKPTRYIFVLSSGASEQGAKWKQAPKLRPLP